MHVWKVREQHPLKQGLKLPKVVAGIIAYATGSLHKINIVLKYNSYFKLIT